MSPQQKKDQEENLKLRDRLRVFVREQLYPLLLRNSKSVHDTNFYMSLTGAMIEQGMQRKQLEFKVGELDFGKESAQADNAEQTRILELLDLFKDEKVADALGVLQGMQNEITQTVTKENKERKLEDLKIELL